MNETTKKLFVATIAAMKTLTNKEKATTRASEAEKAAGKVFEKSSEDLLFEILSPPVVGKRERAWAEIEEPYGKVKEALLTFAKEEGKPLKLDKSIAGGAFRKEARESKNPLVRLAGRLAGRLSTLIALDKKAKEGNTGNANGNANGNVGNDKYAAGWEAGVAAGRAEMAIIIIAACQDKNCTLAKIRELCRKESSGKEREAATSRMAA